MMPLSQSLRPLCSLGHLRSFVRRGAWQGPTSNAAVELWMHRSGCQECLCDTAQCCGSTTICAE